MPRLFLAIPLPKTLQQELAKVRDHRDHWPVRWVPAENLHLTLVFLGERDPKDIDLIRKSIKETSLAVSYFRIRLSYFEINPNRKRPKLIWIKCRNNVDLEKVFDKLYLSLKSKNPDFVSYCRAYLPHVTLGQFRKYKKSTKNESFKLNFKNFIYAPSLPHSDEIYSFVADRITLFESKLGGKHSIYTPIYSAKLKTSP